MDMELRIRDANREELEQAALMIKDSYQEYEARMPPRAWQAYAANILDVHSRLPVSQLIVADDRGKLVGAVTYYPDASATYEAGWAGIRLLAVHPESRGKGLGRTLMDECIQRCRQRGISILGLHTTPLMDVARGMYERMGFVREPRFDHRPGFENVVMAYRLDVA